MNRSDLGQYFIKNGELYYAFGYIQDPAIELENVKTGQRETVVIGSPVSREYNKLFQIPAKEDGYHLDEAIPVEIIHLEDTLDKLQELKGDNSNE